MSLRDTIRACLGRQDQVAAKSGRPVNRRPVSVEVDEDGDLDREDSDGGVPTSPRTEELYQGAIKTVTRDRAVREVVKRART